jgi:hypothetical protein
VTTPQQWRPAPQPQRRPPAPPHARPLPRPSTPNSADYAPTSALYGHPPAQPPPQPAQQIVQQVVHVGNMPTTSVTKQRKRTSHGLHLFLTIITGGAWGILVWFPLAMWHRFGPKEKVVTRHG